MNEEVSSKAIRLAVNATKVDARFLYKVLRKYIDSLNRKNDEKKNVETRIKGKQTVKELIGQNQGVSSMPIGDSGIKDFKKIANKYGVDFAIAKDKKADPPQYTVFFKARDADAITSVLKEYSQKQMKRKEKSNEKKPSILAKLKKFKEIVAKTPRKEKEKRKDREL